MCASAPALPSSLVCRPGNESPDLGQKAKEVSERQQVGWQKGEPHAPSTHSPAFKLDIVRQVEAGGKSKAQLCREHDLSPTLVHRWQQQYGQHGEAAFDKDRPLGETQALERRVAELERLLGQSAAENAFLKNALAAHRKKTAGR